MPYIDVNGCRLYYEEAGSGETILFLHASFSRGILSFGSQLEFFQSRYRCLLPDMREHGRSRVGEAGKETVLFKPGLDGIPEHLTWTTPLLADDMAGFLNGLGIRNVHVAGFSLGGDVALYLAVRYPELVKTLTLIGTTGFVTEGIRKEARNFLPDAVSARGGGRFVDNLFCNHESVRIYGVADTLVHTVDNWLKYPAFNDGELESIKVPVLITAGSGDPYVSPGDLEWLRERLPHAHLEVSLKTGHGPHQAMFQPAWFNNLMADFIKSHS